MKKNIKFSSIFTMAVLSLFFGQSCVYDLEEDTSSILSIESLESETDITAALAPIYKVQLDVFDSPYETFMTCFGADDLTTWWGGNKAPMRVFDRFDYGDGENSDISWLNVTWDGYWKDIYYCNTLIDGLKTSMASEDIVSIGDAEARFFRAYSYLNLVKIYGNMPIILDGITPTGEETRATVLENYQMIEEDLEIAEANLPGPGEVENYGRVSSAAAKALFADLYLTWSGWPVNDESKLPLAASKAKEIIDLNYFELLPIDELWLLENENSKESLFALQFSQDANIYSEWESSNSFHESRGWSDMYPERQFFYDFPEGARKDATFGTDIPQREYTNGVIVDGDPATVPWQESQRFHPMYNKFAIAGDLTLGSRVSGYRAREVYRYAEVLLIYAEASARANGGVATGEALEALNQVKRRAAGLPFDEVDFSVDVSTATADEIFEEKGWELAGEGKRWHDMVRLENVAEVVAKRDVTEEVVLLKAAGSITWKQYIAPIPFDAISTSDLEQNPEGFKIAP